MWKKGDRIKRSSPIHGEMIGTIDEITAGMRQTIYHVTWQTSKTGTIRSRELGGRDDRNWESLGEPDSGAKEASVKASPSAEISRALAEDPRLSSQHTLRAYRSDLAGFEEWSAGRSLSRALVVTYVEELAGQGKSPVRINRALAAIRWWARRKMDAAVAAEHMPPATLIQTITETLAITRIPDLPVPARVREPGLADEEYDHLAGICRADPAPAGARDAALFSLTREHRLKPGTLQQLRRGDLVGDAGGDYQLQMKRPAGSSYEIRLTGPAGISVKDWLAVRDPAVAGGGADLPLFLAINKGGRIRRKGLSGEALRQLLKKRLRQAGLTDVSWHRLGQDS